MPFGELATAYGLLVMPRMPELKKRKITGFVVDTKKKANEIKYKLVLYHEAPLQFIQFELIFRCEETNRKSGLVRRS